MKIIVINCGSSSIKYQLFDMTGPSIMAKGVVEKIGLNGSFIKHESNGKKVTLEGEIIDHQSGIEYMLGILISREHGCIEDFREIDAVGHRVVHGGEKFKSSVLITDEVIAMLEESIRLAPLHNPPNLSGIYAMRSLLPDVPQAGTFDTAFHQSMPDYAYMYAIPYSLYTKYAIRRYGFHGTSHRYVSERAREILQGKPVQKIITCHLGNGASVAAVLDGRSVDTSMGLTPVEGLVMGTRCGDLDPGIMTYVMEREDINRSGINSLINKHSGLLGISGVSSDMRELETAAEQGNERARLALEMFHYRVRKYIGAYAAAMGGVDAVVFTGGIGENSDTSRYEISKGLEFLGLEFDREKNAGVRGQEKIISRDGSRVTAIIIPTNEELMIARDTEQLTMNNK
ncbi:MAG: acetate kinase [Bacteroidales bacterium]|jgi:acetate kinase|nr:acetate kinase [Bacteroidales bacterium]